MMRTILRLTLLAFVVALTQPSVLAADQNSFKVVAKDKNRNPVQGVTLSVLSGGNKFSAGVTDNDGEQNVPLTLGNISGGEKMRIVVRKCRREDGTVTTEILVLRADTRIPPQQNCDDQEAGTFPWPTRGGSVVAVNIDLDTVATSVEGAQAAVTGLPSGPSLVSVQVGGGVGLKQFASINSCRAFLAVSSGATCQSGDKAFAGGVDGALIFGRYLGLLGAVYRTTSISRKGSASTSAGTSSEISKVGSTIELAGVEAFLPSIGRVTLSFDAAAAFQQIRLKETQSLTSASGTSVATTDLSVDTVGPAGGAKIQISITKRWGAQAGYQYIQGKNTPAVDERNQVVLFGIYFRFP